MVRRSFGHAVLECKVVNKGHKAEHIEIRIIGTTIVHKHKKSQTRICTDLYVKKEIIICVLIL